MGKFTVDFLDDLIGNFPTGEDLGGLLGLGDQHPQTVFPGNAQLFRIQQQLGSGRIVNHIQHPFQMGEKL